MNIMKKLNKVIGLLIFWCVVDLAVTISWFVVDKNLYPIIAFSMILCFFIGFSSLLFEVIRIKKAFVNERTKEVSSNITHVIQNYDVKVGP